MKTTWTGAFDGIRRNTEDENQVAYTFAYTLTITEGDNAHTTGWTDASKDIPDTIIKIVNGIKKIVSKEKIV